MIWRLLHIVVLAALVLAAADVYKIKYELTLQAERVAKLRAELRREQDAIAACAPNGASSTGPTACRNWRSAI